MTDDFSSFAKFRGDNIEALKSDADIQKAGVEFVRRSSEKGYSYNFDWMGVPIIQYPQDMIAVQEIIWSTKPDLIIETGVARGGSVVYYASLLQLAGQGKVLGIDIDIRPHNREVIEAHPMADHIDLIQGSSIDPEIISRVNQHAQDAERVMVVLDSNHTHEHVLAELNAYAPMVTNGCYLVVMDTVVDDMPADYFSDRPWGPGNNPKTAVKEFLGTNDRFVRNEDIDAKLLISVALHGYLRCIKD